MAVPAPGGCTCCRRARRLGRVCRMRSRMLGTRRADGPDRSSPPSARLLRRMDSGSEDALAGSKGNGRCCRWISVGTQALRCSSVRDHNGDSTFAASFCSAASPIWFQFLTSSICLSSCRCMFPLRPRATSTICSPASSLASISIPRLLSPNSI